MSAIVFVTPAQERVVVPIKPGTTVMEAAIASEVPGIEAQCYGAGVCGTCHVFTTDATRALLDEPTDWERDMLEALPLANGSSRLSCQIRFSDALDGAEFVVPERQDAMS